jgi:hypothetical protein
LPVTILRHQVSRESGTVAPVQLLVCFFSWNHHTGSPLDGTRSVPNV